MGTKLEDLLAVLLDEAGRHAGLLERLPAASTDLCAEHASGVGDRHALVPRVAELEATLLAEPGR